ncbi:type II toxin-antitoxin system HigB family toxin [Leptospira noguchii]|uniref:type II toxin-antitoxin system HigB family toxin n=1 Tax=Leptospira noguchii TaxID=28182 RepID=UPI0002489220|nr:type II toxin-antitoxin system HigB family toxin [Leptospira noguchii]
MLVPILVANKYIDMRIISRKVLKDFYENPKYSDAKIPIEVWYKDTLKSKWASPNAIKEKYRNASFLKNNRVIFNIHGNKYRLIVKIHYNLQTIFIRFIGTHEQYDKIDVGEI